jgi:hypothetical protein
MGFSGSCSARDRALSPQQRQLLELGIQRRNLCGTANNANSSTIQAIVLKYEKARELVSASHIAQNLQVVAPVSSSGGTQNASSDDYWTFSSEHYGDEYWQAESTSVIRSVLVNDTGTGSKTTHDNNNIID